MGQLGDISPEASVAIGIVVGLLSTSIQSLGLTLQRQSHLREDEKVAPETRKPPYKRPRWQIGMLMFVISNLVGSTIQITTLPLPVLSTLQASGLVFNTAFATLLLKEPFTRFSLIGTILTCTGAALIAVFGAVAEPAHNLQQLLDLLKGEGFIIWMAATILVVLATIVFSHILKVWSSYKHMSRHIQKHERPRSRSSSGLDKPPEPRTRRLSLTAQLPKSLQVRVVRLKFIRGLCYALISGILSAHSLLVAKSAVELLVRTIIDHNNQFNRFQSWLILIALLFFALSQLYYLHLGLRLCSTSVLYPFVFCIYNIVAILDGLIYFQQASRLPVLHAILVAVGTVILLSGVLALSWRLDDTTPMEPATQVVPPRNSLIPGMGMLSHSDELERSPLLHSFSRSSTDPSHPFDERTPLLTRPARRTTLTRTTISPGGAGTRDIWAELDDEENTYDFIASLPQSASPQLGQKPDLHIPKKRRASLPSKGNDAPPETAQTRQRRQTLNEYSHSVAQDAAAKILSPISSSPANDTTLGPKSDSLVAQNPQSASTSTSTAPSPTQTKAPRDRRVTVHFEESNIRETSPRRSRWDEGYKSPQKIGKGGIHFKDGKDDKREDPG